jgi:adenylate kinase
MRAIVTGQVGIEKKRFLTAVQRLAGQRGQNLATYHVGDRMYAEAPDVRPGRILDLPLSRLSTLRRAVFRDIIAESKDQQDIAVNTHATFRWRHGLFSAFDFDQLKLLEPDMLICLVDNIEVVHHRLHQEHAIDATLKDLMVWREEEIMTTRLVAQALGIAKQFYVLPRGRNTDAIETAWRLIFRNTMRKVYPSFPMTHVANMPEVLAEIDAFRETLARHFITFDPFEIGEKQLLDLALEAAREGQDFIDAPVCLNSRPTTLRVPVKQILEVAGDIDGQIYMRDFELIDQADMIVSYIPELPGGLPGLSSGVERELHHAFEHGKEVYVVWKPARPPSPFITETATRVFPSVEQALEHFEKKGMFPQVNLFGH